MNKLFVSPQAQNDLHEIKSYISDTLENPTAAVNVVSRITTKLKTLIDMQGIGTHLSAKVSFETDYRFLVCGKYLAFYRFENNTIFVDRIIYGGRDYVKILFPEIAEDITKDDR
jgi:plasmid stabilization system protein ParE